jgi:hypothetical protein
MPNTYSLISSNVLSSAAASVTFSSIPATFTDLVLRVSVRGTSANTFRDFILRANGDSTTLYSTTRLRGDGSAANSNRETSDTRVLIGQGVIAASSTANTFSSVEIYIPSYTASQNKPMSGFAASDVNSTSAYLLATAHLYRSTTAISQLAVISETADFAIGSSFYLYGIKNS